MRAAVSFVVFSALCAAVAFGAYMPFPGTLTQATSPLKVGIGHFYVAIQVPPEPKEQSDQTLMFFVGGDSNFNFKGHSPIRVGGALLWTAKDHWLAIGGAKACDDLDIKCKLLWENDADISVEPGDLVFVNVSNIPGKNEAGYEVSVPFKGKTTGFRTAYRLDQERIEGVFVSAHTENVKRRDQFPEGMQNTLRILYSTVLNESKEIPLVWSTGSRTMWGQEFIQKGDVLTFNWQ